MAEAETTGNRVHRFAGPLLVGVLSDTHVNERGARRLPAEVPALFHRLGVGLILHAGDLNALAVLDQLRAVAPVLAVRGNSDLPETRAALPARIDLAVAGRSVALIHGDAGPTANRTADALAGTVDCVVYGHSHVPRMEMVRGTMMFNPGSPTDKRWWPDYSVGLLRVDEDGIVPELVVFKAAIDLDRIRA